MSTPQPIVEIRSVSKRYGDGPPVIEGLDLTLLPGDFVSLIGPSGCGKSTILKLVAGLNPASTGELRVAGTTPRQARDKQAFIFQDATLLPWLNTLHNAELPLKLRGDPTEARATKAREMLALVGLDAVRHYYPRQLSGGMKMRVSLARALTLAPQLLLLDEPFGALDEMTRFRLNEELLALRERTPFTAIFVTHSVAEAVFLSNRIIVMAANPGRIHADIAVRFDHPRRADLRQRSEYQARVAEVTRHLHEVEASVRA